jgi:prophage regulatory protein
MAPKKERFIRLREVMHRCSLGKTAIYDRIKKKTFPASIPLGDGPGAVAWLESEVDAWIAERVASTRGKAPLPARSTCES